MSVIYRWATPKDQEAILLAIPEGSEVEAVEIGAEGVSLRKMHLERPEPNAPIEFPLVHVWDDPSRSPRLQRPDGDEWEDEDTDELLRQWEQMRLEQFYRHCLNTYRSMQVVYLQPPQIRPTRFHVDGELCQGWHIEMIAAIFGGCAPNHLDAWSFGKKKPAIYMPESKVIVPKRPKLVVL